MSLTNMVEQKKLEQVDKSMTMTQFKSSVEHVFMLNRIGLLDDDELLSLIDKYVQLTEAQDAKDGNGRSRY